MRLIVTCIQSSDPHHNLTRFKNFESVAKTARLHERPLQDGSIDFDDYRYQSAALRRPSHADAL
jgi:hypothetical protein